MYKNLYLAKSDPEQTIAEHTEELLKHFEILQDRIKSYIIPEAKEGIWNILKLAIIYHDAGKVNTKFQNKLYASMKKDIRLPDNSKYPKEIPHNCLSPAFLPKEVFEGKMGFKKQQLRVLCSAIYYHHNRFGDEKEIRNSLLDCIKNDLPKYLSSFKLLQGLKITEVQSTFRRYTKLDTLKNRMEENDFFIKFVLVKGLLNRCDYAASAGIESVEEDLVHNGHTPSSLVSSTFDSKGWKLRPLQQYMKENNSENIVVIASTGMGKTEASLLWANGEKTFFTLPLRVSINAMYKRIKDEDLKFEKTALLHSSALGVYMEEHEDYLTASSAYNSARLLSYPLTICTVDQLFRFIFKYHGFEQILATLAYSRVIIDEIQMYSPEIVAALLIGLSYIQKIGGKFAIVTATFPKLFQREMQKLKLKYVFANSDDFLTKRKRHKIRIVNSDIDLSMVEQQAKTNKVLVIANTVAKAQYYYRELNIENKRLLHSRFIKKHRQILEDKILEFAPNPKADCKTGVWVTTQIVEASLDLDFDVLFTEMCSIDSLFQRTGRVYRNRDYLGSCPNVYIFINKNGRGNIIDRDIYDYSVRAISQFDDRLLTEQDKQKIMDLVYDPEVNIELEKSEYYTALTYRINLLKDTPCYELTKEEAIKNFRNILSYTIIPEQIYDKLETNKSIDAWINILNDTEAHKMEKAEVKEEILKYTMSVSAKIKLPIYRDSVIYKKSDIHRCSAKYDFDEDKLTGQGLIANEQYYDMFR